MARRAAEVKDSGFPALKVKVGTDRAEDIRRIRAIRQAVGDRFPIRIDANQGWDPPEAVLILRDLARFDLQFCEQPVAHWNHAPLEARSRAELDSHYGRSSPAVTITTTLASWPAGACDLFNIKLASREDPKRRPRSMRLPRQPVSVHGWVHE